MPFDSVSQRDNAAMNRDDTDQGIVNIDVGFAPLPPAEFVDISLGQLEGQVGEQIGDQLPCPPALESRAFTVNPTRVDPYKNFKFRVKWDGRYVAGVSKVSLEKGLSSLAPQDDAGSAGKPPGRDKYEPITLERGVTQDPDFQHWAASALDAGTSPIPRKDVILESYDEAGHPAASYTLKDCWVSEYQALPDLDANANAIAIQHIKLENEGWAQDTSVDEPREPLL